MAVHPVPVIKYIDGKTQLLPEIQKRLPKEISHYFEPFIGGGTVMWSQYGRSDIKKITINDYNPELTNLYRVIKEKPHKLIKHLATRRNTEKYYYHLREMDRKESYHRRSDVTRASRFIALNKFSMCRIFSGLTCDILLVHCDNACHFYDIKTCMMKRADSIWRYCP